MLVVDYREFQTPYLLCDCNLLWLLRWIKDRNVFVKNTKCSYPQSLQGQLITSLRPELLTCGKDTNWSYTKSDFSVQMPSHWPGHKDVGFCFKSSQSMSAICFSWHLKPFCLCHQGS